MTDLAPLEEDQAPGTAAWEALVQAELDVSARLCAATERLADQMADQRAFSQRLAEAVNWVPAPAIPLGSLPVVQANAGPPRGPAGSVYAWAVQRVTVGPIGATTDAVTIYEGNSSADVVNQNARHTFTGAAGAFADWEPGRTGWILRPGSSLIVTGTITGANPVLSWDVLVVDMDFLRLFLL